MRQARPWEIITERATEEKASKQSKRTSYWRLYLDISFSLLVFTLSSSYHYFFWTWQMQKMKPIQATYQYYNHFLWHILPMKERVIVKSSRNITSVSAKNWKLLFRHVCKSQTCLNKSFQFFADTLVSK